MRRRAGWGGGVSDRDARERLGEFLRGVPELARVHRMGAVVVGATVRLDVWWEDVADGWAGFVSDGEASPMVAGEMLTEAHGAALAAVEKAREEAASWVEAEDEVA